MPYPRTSTVAATSPALLRTVALPSLVAVCLSFVGCSSPRIALSEFETAGPIRLTVDTSKLELAVKPTGAYQIGTGDVLELYMPRIMATVKDDIIVAEDKGPYHMTRIDSSGRITVPLLGRVEVTGLTLTEVEELLAGRYYPQYITVPPSIVARVSEYFTQPVSVMGAVRNSGTYDLQRREMSLVTLFSKAGGIIEEGASVIRIRRRAGDVEEPIVLPVEGGDIQFADVQLRAGDVVEVERLDPLAVSVIGLVNSPTAIPYPPGTEFFLLQAIAMAGGLNLVAAPKYATVYRSKPNGEVVSRRFRITGSGDVPDGFSVLLKPGDVVAVEHTTMTLVRVILSEVVRVGIGLTPDFQ